ncbi:hypothetical protein [Azospirillum palustre]
MRCIGARRINCPANVHRMWMAFLQCGIDLAFGGTDKNFYCEFVANSCYVSATRLPRQWQVRNLLSNLTPVCLLFQQLNRMLTLMNRMTDCRLRPSAAESGRVGPLTERR